MRPLRVCIDARLTGGHGGVEQMVIGLAAGLSKLPDGDEEYLFLVSPGHQEWLRPHLSGPCRTIVAGEPPRDRSLRTRISWQLDARLPGLRRGGWPPPTGGYEGKDLAAIGVSDSTIESAGVDLMHFSLALGFLTNVPSIFQPHDLQHLHMPQFFTPEEIARRELAYRAYCERAELVVMMTSSGKRDLVERFGLPPEKVAVVPGFAVLSEYPQPAEADLEAVREKLELPEAFALFPARAWPHKNHERLLEALAILRDRHGLSVTVVCPGRQDDRLDRVRAQAAKLGLADAVLFPGFVTPLELRSLYSLARMLVFPSLFEGWGLPVSEALWAGLPVACSAIPPLLDMAGDTALTFDPHDPGQIAEAVKRLWSDPALRESLAERGRKRSERFSFDQAARLYRAHYRRVGGRPLSAEDRELLEAPPLI